MDELGIVNMESAAIAQPYVSPKIENCNQIVEISLLYDRSFSTGHKSSHKFFKLKKKQKKKKNKLQSCNFLLLVIAGYHSFFFFNKISPFIFSFTGTSALIEIFYTKFFLIGLVVFYSISTFVAYLMPNHIYIYIYIYIYVWKSQNRKIVPCGVPFIAIAPRSNLARSCSTWEGPIYGSNRIKLRTYAKLYYLK